MSGEPDGAAAADAAKQFISLAEAADLTGLSHDHLRNLVRSGTVWGTKIGRNWVTTEAAVKAYIATERRRGPKPKDPREGSNSSA